MPRAEVEALSGHQEHPGPAMVASDSSGTYPALPQARDSGNQSYLIHRETKSWGQENRPLSLTRREAAGKQTSKWGQRGFWGGMPYSTGGRPLWMQHLINFQCGNCVHINAWSVTSASGRRQKDKEFFMEKVKKPQGASSTKPFRKKIVSFLFPLLSYRIWSTPFCRNQVSRTGSRTPLKQCANTDWMHKAGRTLVRRE